MGTIALIQEIRSGRNSTRAQETLYGMAQKELLERLRVKIPARLRSRMDAEDVLQVAFMKAIQGLDRFEPQDENSFFAWVYRISKNLISDQNRRRSVGVLHFVTGENEPGVRQSKVKARGHRAESLVHRKEWIESLLAQLGAKEAQIIRLRWLEGRTFEEIATQWKKTPGAVQRFHSRAWQRFKEIAGQDFEQDERRKSP